MPALRKEFGYKNPMAVPKIEKIVVNMGLGEATANAKILDTAVDELARDHRPEAGRHPRQEVDRSFKLREGMPIGAMVTLRGDQMYEFLDRLINDRAAARARLPRRVAARRSTAAATTRSASRAAHLPRDRLRQGRQGEGDEHHIVTTAKNDEEARGFCSTLGMPFRTELMAKTAKIAKEAKKPKFKVRQRNRCKLCGRPRGFLRKFELCRICFRAARARGDIPGVIKSSW